MNFGEEKVIWDKNEKLLKMIEKAKQYKIPFTKEGKAGWGDRFINTKAQISEKFGDEDFQAARFNKFGGMKYDKHFLRKLDTIAYLRKKKEFIDDLRIDPTLFSFLEPT